MPGRQGPPDDLLGLGDVEAALGLGATPEGDVGQPDVVVDAGSWGSVIRVGTPERLEDERAHEEADSGEGAEGEDGPAQVSRSTCRAQRCRDGIAERR